MLEQQVSDTNSLMAEQNALIKEQNELLKGIIKAITDGSYEPPKTGRPKSVEKKKTAPKKQQAVKPVEKKETTQDDVRAALADYRDSHGIQALKDLLKGFGAAKFSEIQKEDYQDIVETVNTKEAA